MKYFTSLLLLSYTQAETVIDIDFCPQELSIIMYDCSLSEDEKRERINFILRNQKLSDFSSSILGKEHCLFKGHYFDNSIMLEFPLGED